MRKYRGRSMRHPFHDYRKGGYYFVTLVTKERVPYFGGVKNKRMILNKYGKAAYNCWLDIPHHNDRVQLDEFIIMPEHIHGILFIKDSGCCFDNADSFLWQEKWKSSLSSVVRGYKIGVTKYFRACNNYEFAWVKSFHDYIISDLGHLKKCRHYIKNNPLKYAGRAGN